MVFIVSEPAAEPSRRRSSVRWLWRLLVVLILAAGVGGFYALQKFKPRPAVRAPVRQLPLVRVDPARAGEGPLSVTGNGLVRARHEVVLGAEVSGRVVEVNPRLVAGGTLVRNEMIVRIDPAPFQAALAQARADRASARVALSLAQRNVKRTQELISQKFLSTQTLEERTAARDQAQATLARVQAQIDQRELDLARTEIRAPFDARVLSKRVNVGESVQPGRELGRIFAVDALEIAVSLTDRDLSLIADPWRGSLPDPAATRSPRKAPANGPEAGTSPATIVVEHGGARYRWPAVVDRVEAAVDSATRTFNVVVRVLEPRARGESIDAKSPSGPPLVVGMYATVEIAGRDQGAYVTIPRSALRDGGVVWTIDAASRLVANEVRVLSETDERVALDAAGLPAGARVVTSDLRVVTPGMQVRVVEEAASSGAGRAAGS